MKYTYVCPDCKQSYELRFRMGTNPATVPCNCGGIAHREFRAVNIHYKGSGWGGHQEPVSPEKAVFGAEHGAPVTDDYNPIAELAHV